MLIGNITMLLDTINSTITKLLKKGATYQFIGEQIGYSRSNTVRLAKKLGLNSKAVKYLTETEKNKIIKWLNKGKSISEIARLLGRSKKTIHNFCNKEHLQRKSSYWWSKEDDELLEDLLGTIPIYKIAKQLKRTKNAVRQRVERLGLDIRDKVDYFTTMELSEITGLHPATINRWINLKQIEAIQDNKNKKGMKFRHYISIESFRDFYLKNKTRKSSLKDLSPEVLEFFDIDG